MIEEDAERIGGKKSGERGARVVDRIEVAEDAKERSGDRDERQGFAAAYERLKHHQERARDAPDQFRQDVEQVRDAGEHRHLAGSEPFERDLFGRTCLGNGTARWRRSYLWRGNGFAGKISPHLLNDFVTGASDSARKERRMIAQPEHEKTHRHENPLFAGIGVRDSKVLFVGYLSKKNSLVRP